MSKTQFALGLVAGSLLSTVVSPIIVDALKQPEEKTAPAYQPTHSYSTGDRAFYTKDMVKVDFGVDFNLSSQNRQCSEAVKALTFANIAQTVANNTYQQLKTDVSVDRQLVPVADINRNLVNVSSVVGPCSIENLLTIKMGPSL